MPRNSYFTRPQDRPAELMRESAFEEVVRQLGLTPEQYPDSEQLRAWVERNKNERYVPPELLQLWHLQADPRF